jgi:hypothetical protein
METKAFVDTDWGWLVLINLLNCPVGY